MIRIYRDRTSVPKAFLPGGSAKNEQALLAARADHLIRLQTKPKAAHGFDPKWWKTAKPQLVKEARRKCAYCEASTTAVSYGDVEHFRPKSKWWWLTCCWENYLLSCQRCNQEAKNDEFPFGGAMAPDPVKVTAASTPAELAAAVGKLTPDSSDAAACQTHWETLFRTEKPDLIDPYNEEPEKYFAYEADDDKALVKVIARSQNASVKRRVEACVRLYGLNREELCELRYEYYEALAASRDALAEPLSVAGRARILRSLKRRAARKGQFAGMCRYFLIDQWGILPPEVRD